VSSIPRHVVQSFAWWVPICLPLGRQPPYPDKGVTLTDGWISPLTAAGEGGVARVKGRREGVKGRRVKGLAPPFTAPLAVRLPRGEGWGLIRIRGLPA
jgi:hypothetical protein